MENTTLKKSITSDSKKFIISKQDVFTLVLALISFFIGRVILFQTINPILFGFLANYFLKNPYLYIISLFSTVGLFTKLSGIQFFKYLFPIVSLSLCNYFLTKKKVNLKIYTKYAIVSVVVSLSGIIFSALDDLNLYMMLIATLEGVLTFFLSIVLKKSSEIITGVRKKQVITHEGMLSLAILFGGIIAGASDVHFSFVSLRVFMVTLLILFVAFKGGSAFACLVSVLMCFTLYVVGYIDVNTILIFSIASVTAGILKIKGKTGTVAGFLLGLTCGAFFLGVNFFDKVAIYSILTSIIAFMALPIPVYFHFNTAINPVVDNCEEYLERIKEITQNQLMAFSGSFLKLSKTLSSLSEKENVKPTTTKIIEEVKKEMCLNCDRNAYCWQEKQYETYQAIFAMFSSFDKQGYVEIFEIPAFFNKNCVKFKKFVESTNRICELTKLSIDFSSQIEESRELVCEQLKGVSKIMNNLCEDLNLHINFKDDLESSIFAELSKNKIDINSVVVFENKQGNYEVSITHKQCNYKKACTNEIIPIVSKVLGRKMRVASDECLIKKGNCSLKLVEEQKFKIITGVSRLKKTGSKLSGDNYSFLKLKSGNCLLALSDGMGSGERASEESKAAIELLEDFLESGFEVEMAVKMINSALILKGNEDTFSTLDICALNLSSGEAEFIKIGAATTFLVRNGTVHSIISRSLPIGILKSVDIEITRKMLQNGDYIVMVTDGILDVIEDKQWIYDTMANYKGYNPQELSDQLVFKVKEKTKDYFNDDITVLAAKVFKA